MAVSRVKGGGVLDQDRSSGGTEKGLESRCVFEGAVSRTSL